MTKEKRSPIPTSKPHIHSVSLGKIPGKDFGWLESHTYLSVTAFIVGMQVGRYHIVEEEEESSPNNSECTVTRRSENDSEKKGMKGRY